MMGEMNQVVTNNLALEQAGIILGEEYCQELTYFFKDIIASAIERSKKVKRTVYISFVTRRCSCLFYFFLKNADIDYDSTPASCEIMTETDFANYGRRIGEKIYKNENNGAELEEFVLVDDSISYGRALNNTLNSFYREAEQYIKGKLKNDEEIDAALHRLADYFRGSVSIRVFAEKRQSRLLQSNYEDRLEFQMSFSVSRWNDFSMRLAELLLCADVANTAFVVSLGTDGVNPKSIRWPNREWGYRGHKEKIYYKPFFEKNTRKVLAFATIRQTNCGTERPGRLIPFLFLPKLDRGNLELLEKKIFFKLSQANVITKESYEKWGDFRENSLSFRLNFVTTYLSHCLLADALPGVLDKQITNWDTEKIQWNYIGQKVGEEKLSDILSRIIPSPSALLDSSEIDSLFSSFLDVEPIALYDQETQQLVSNKEQEDTWKEYFEEYLFELALRLETVAYKMVNGRFVPDKSILNKLDEERYRDLSEFIEGFNWFVQYNHPEQRESLPLPELLSLMLLMMDAGAMSVVSDESEMQDVSSHQIRICEQAMTLLPRRYNVHTDLLFFLESHSWLKEEREKELVRTYLGKTAEGVGKTPSQLEEDCQVLLDFKNRMWKGGQRIGDWAVGINRHFLPCNQSPFIKLSKDDRELRTERRRNSVWFSEAKREIGMG